MNEIKLNNVNNNLNNIPKDASHKSYSISVDMQEINDSFVSANKKKGTFAKIGDKICEMFSIGITESEVSSKIKDFQKGKITKEETQKYIYRYEKSNKNVGETASDTLASVAAFGIGMIAKKSKLLVSALTQNSSKYTGRIIAAGAAASFAGAIAVKAGVSEIDSLGKDKEIRESEKTAKKNIITGSIDGLTGALSAIHPSLVPVGIAINAFTRYVEEKQEDNTLPSISDFIERQKDSAGIGVIGAVTIAGVAAKGHIKVSKIKAAIENTKINKKHVINYKPMQGQLTEFQSLARDIGYDLSVIIKGEKFNPDGITKLDEDFLKILLEKGKNGDIEGKLKKIEQENIFLPKYLQTVVDIPDTKQRELVKQIDQLVEASNARKNGSSYNGRDYGRSWYSSSIDRSLEYIEKKGMDIEGLKDLQAILKRIKSDCPASRSIEDAQKMVTKEYKDEYTITKLLGVGSIAESYLANNKKGEEVVIKLVKQHFLDTDKIAADKAKVMKKIDERAKRDTSWFFSKQTIKTPERKEYDVNQIDNMYKVWGNEINLSEEALSASQIGQQAVNFSPVGVIDSKKSIFIMQKAKGVQLDSDKFASKWKEANLGEEDFKNFVENYVKVYCEQLFSLPKEGMKVVQSDPHGGNILVDIAQIKNLKSGSKPITIIDYGNTTKTDQNQAIKNLFNHLDYLVGNTDEIAKSMLEGAKLGGNNKNKVAEELSKELREKIYNCDTKIDVDNPVKIFSTVNSFCLNFMQSKNIIPNASHINQMKAEETYIISNLGCLNNVAEECGYDISKAIDRNVIIKQLVNEMVKATKDAGSISPVLTAKEIMKRYNYFVNNTENALSSLGINFNIV